MRKYVLGQASTLLRRLAFRMRRAAEPGDPESIHDLRVAIRRFQQCLRVFRQFLPRGEVNKIQRRVRKIMNLAGEVRNRDIALDLLKQAGTPPGSALADRLAQERKQAQQQLLSVSERWGRRNISQKWRARLGV